MEIKILIIGKQPKKEKVKPIYFFKLLKVNGEVCGTSTSPKEFNFIELISLGYSDDFDLMFAYNDKLKRSEGYLFLGKFNSGIV